MISDSNTTAPLDTHTAITSSGDNHELSALAMTLSTGDSLGSIAMRD